MKTREIDTQKIDSIKLPKSLRNGRVFVMEDKDGITIKKIASPPLAEIRRRLKTIKGTISEREINQEIQKYRKGR